MEPDVAFREDDDTSRIVELFARPQPYYDAATVRRLTGVTSERLETALDEGHVEPVTEGGRLRYKWEDVANLALERWTPREIARRLERTGHSNALPPLNQFHTVRIELPLYQIRLLHRLAEEKSAEVGAPRTVSDILEYELAAMATGDPEMEERFPGFELAALFPKPYRTQHLVDDRCLYCGGDVDGGERVCMACRRQHVPER